MQKQSSIKFRLAFAVGIITALVMVGLLTIGVIVFARVQNLVISESLTPEVLESLYHEQMNYAMAIALSAPLLGALLTFVVSSWLLSPIRKLTHIAAKLGKGEVIKDTLECDYAELSGLSVALAKISTLLKQSADFSKRLHDSNFDKNFSPVSEADVLGKSLLDMEGSLRDASMMREHERFISKGMVIVNDIIRENSQEIDGLASELLTGMVKHLSARAGVIYFVQDDEEEEKNREAATYAVSEDYIELGFKSKMQLF